MGKRRTAIARSMCWAIFSRYCGHRTMTIKGAKRNVPHLLQAQQAPICLWSISETLQCQKFRGTVTKSTVSNRVCWSLKVLWGSVSADFRQFQVGREGKKERKIPFLFSFFPSLRLQQGRGTISPLPHTTSPLSPLIVVKA